MKHLERQYSHFFGESFHLDDVSLHFPSSVHHFYFFDRPIFLRFFRLYIETNRIAISVGFFLPANHLKNSQ